MTLPHTREAWSLKTFGTPNKLSTPKMPCGSGRLQDSQSVCSFQLLLTKGCLLHAVPSSVPPVPPPSPASLTLFACRDLLFSHVYSSIRALLWFLVPGSSPLRYPPLSVRAVRMFLSDSSCALYTNQHRPHLSPISLGLHLHPLSLPLPRRPPPPSLLP